MKTNTRLLSLLIALCGLSVSKADLTIPSDGTDLDFNPTQSVEVDLSQAITGNWNDPVPAANAGKGIYDRNQWAVVFKFRSVNIPAGVTVTFKNHASRAPVVWLVQQGVTIIGPGNAANAAPAVGLDGASGGAGDLGSVPAEPGPGGFRGGPKGLLGDGAGLGIGGGRNHWAYGAATFLGAYGNPRLIPLIGGSGGGAGDAPGGAGGGAMLIACSGSITLSGRISSNGGSVYGTGGGIRLVATSLLGDGRLTALGISPGRIRIEANQVSPTITISPESIAVPPPQIPVIWPPSNAPSVRITSVAAASVPTDPRAPLNTGADVGIQNSGISEILVETTNFPVEGVVRVRIAQKYGGFDWANATYVGGNNARATWKATSTFTAGYTTLQARAIVP